jgi:hypothetical protein
MAAAAADSKAAYSAGLIGWSAPMAGDIRFVPDDVVLNLVAVAGGELPGPGGEGGGVGGRGEAGCRVAIEQGDEGESGMGGNGRYHPIRLCPLIIFAEIEGLLDLAHAQGGDLRQVVGQGRVVILRQGDVEAEAGAAVGDGAGQRDRNAARQEGLPGAQCACAE